ncbi:MAG TPA: hypothetical protein VJH92_05500 [Candidatus Nanoarchaeia archaeon]|nr:hypothetical protein [Candidatus Nanoarchaeia archaeon]
MIILEGETIHGAFAKEVGKERGQVFEEDGRYGMKLVSERGSLSTQLVSGKDLWQIALDRRYSVFGVAVKDFEIIGPFKYLNLVANR